MSFGSEKSLLSREVISDGFGPAVMVTKNGKVYANITPGKNDMIVMAAAAEVKPNVRTIESVELTGEAVLKCTACDCKAVDATAATSLKFDYTALKATEASEAEYWVQIPTGVTPTYGTGVSLHTGDTLVTTAGNSNHIIVRMFGTTAVIYVL